MPDHLPLIRRVLLTALFTAGLTACVDAPITYTSTPPLRSTSQADSVPSIPEDAVTPQGCVEDQQETSVDPSKEETVCPLPGIVVVGPPPPPPPPPSDPPPLSPPPGGGGGSPLPPTSSCDPTVDWDPDCPPEPEWAPDPSGACNQYADASQSWSNGSSRDCDIAGPFMLKTPLLTGCPASVAGNSNPLNSGGISYFSLTRSGEIRSKSWGGAIRFDVAYYQGTAVSAAGVPRNVAGEVWCQVGIGIFTVR